MGLERLGRSLYANHWRALVRSLLVWKDSEKSMISNRNIVNKQTKTNIWHHQISTQLNNENTHYTALHIKQIRHTALWFVLLPENKTKQKNIFSFFFKLTDDIIFLVFITPHREKFFFSVDRQCLICKVKKLLARDQSKLALWQLLLKHHAENKPVNQSIASKIKNGNK